MRSHSRLNNVRGMPSAPRTLFAVVLLLSAGACDTLSARRTAKEGTDAYKKGQYEAALERYEASLAEDPQLAPVQLNRGFTCLQLFKAGNKADRDRYAACAIDAFGKYQRAKPEDARGRDYLLQSFVDTLRYDDALAYFQPELAQTPPGKEAMALLGQIAAKLGRVELALEWCNKRAEATPNDPAAHQCRGTLTWEHLHKHPEITGEERLRWADQGIEALTKAMALAPEQPESYTFANLLHRERALGHCGGVPLPGAPGADGGVPAAPLPGADGGVELDPAMQAACDEARAKDVAEANRLQGLALTKLRASQGASPSPSNSPAASPAKGG